MYFKIVVTFVLMLKRSQKETRISKILEHVVNINIKIGLSLSSYMTLVVKKNLSNYIIYLGAK